MHAPESRLTVTSRETAGAAVLVLCGEIDLGNAAWTAAVLRGATVDAAPSGLVIVNLTGVVFLSAAGVHTLYDFAADCTGRGLRVRLLAPAGSIVERLVVLTELDRHVPVFARLDEALRADARSAG